MPTLPARPSREHLRKHAKRLAREQSVSLAAAQHAMAKDYGFHSWAELMQHVASVRGEITASPSPLFAAVRARDVDTVRRLLAEGANPRHDDGRETPLHVAARLGPCAMVETLLEGGAFDWQLDRKERTPLDVARTGRARERSAIIAVLDRHAIADPSFRAAIDAIHAGDVAALARLLDAEPRLLRDRILGPEIYRRSQRRGYFTDPKLFWFVANNPTLVERMPSNMADVAQVMIDRGVERADLEYALGLHHVPLERARTRCARCSMRGQPMSALLAASLGADEQLRELLRTASREDVQTAFGLAAINQHAQAALLALDAGADIDARLPVHVHSTALHQASLDDDAAFVELLLKRGARTDQRDTLWDGTPLGWAIHQERPNARAVLERRAAGG